MFSVGSVALFYLINYQTVSLSVSVFLSPESVRLVNETSCAGNDSALLDCETSNSTGQNSSLDKTAGLTYSGKGQTMPFRLDCNFIMSTTSLYILEVNCSGNKLLQLQ